MEIEIKESKTLEEGLHIGEISKVEFRTEPYEYTDIYIKSDETEIKWGAPSTVSEKSKLGKLLAQFETLVVGGKIDPEKVLVAKHVKFMVVHEKGKDGTTYARVVDGSIKPLQLSSSSVSGPVSGNLSDVKQCDLDPEV